jgi:hypothetical protein
MTDYFHRFVLTDGSVIVVPHRQAQRVLDVRDNRRVPETVWEVQLDNGLVRRLWPSDVRSWDQEEVQ